MTTENSTATLALCPCGTPDDENGWHACPDLPTPAPSVTSLAHFSPVQLSDVRYALRQAGRDDLLARLCADDLLAEELRGMADALDAHPIPSSMFRTYGDTLRKYADGWRRTLVNAGLPGHPRTYWALTPPA